MWISQRDSIQAPRGANQKRPKQKSGHSERSLQKPPLKLQGKPYNESIVWLLQQIINRPSPESIMLKSAEQILNIPQTIKQKSCSSLPFCPTQPLIPLHRRN